MKIVRMRLKKPEMLTSGTLAANVTPMLINNRRGVTLRRSRASIKRSRG